MLQPKLRQTSDFIGRIRCKKCKSAITTEQLLYYNGDIYCLECGEKLLKHFEKQLKQATSSEWAKFYAACENAQIDALAVAEFTDDGGTCNFDSTFIEWPRLNEVAFEIVLDKIGLVGHKTKWLGSKGVIISPPNVGQAYKRTKAAEAMTAAFKQFGYNAVTWYQCD